MTADRSAAASRESGAASGRRFVHGREKGTGLFTSRQTYFRDHEIHLSRPARAFENALARCRAGGPGIAELWWRAGAEPAVQAARGFQPRLETSNPEMAVDLNVLMTGDRCEVEVGSESFANPLEHALALRRKALIGAKERPISA